VLTDSVVVGPTRRLMELHPSSFRRKVAGHKQRPRIQQTPAKSRTLHMHGASSQRSSSAAVLRFRQHGRSRVRRGTETLCAGTVTGRAYAQPSLRRHFPWSRWPVALAVPNPWSRGRMDFWLRTGRKEEQKSALGLNSATTPL